MQSTKFKLLGSILCIAAVVGVAPLAVASSLTASTSTITIVGTNFAILGMGGVPSGRPSCHNTSGFPTAYAFDISTNKGKALLSLAQAALLSGKQLMAIGGTTCTNTGAGNIETLTQLTLWQ